MQVDDVLGGEEAWANKDQTEHKWYILNNLLYGHHHCISIMSNIYILILNQISTVPIQSVIQ